jgi:hypothetical protein
MIVKVFSLFYALIFHEKRLYHSFNDIIPHALPYLYRYFMYAKIYSDPIRFEETMIIIRAIKTIKTVVTFINAHFIQIVYSKKKLFTKTN